MINQLVVTERKKVIIFSGFDQVLNLCEDVLSDIQKEGDFKHARIDGRTGSAWRNLGVHLFNNDHRYMVFLISIKAGGEGLNLVSASNVMFLDEDWNPQVMRQAEARVHRLGQKKPVTVFKIHSRGTVEEQMIGRLAKKSYLGAKVTENMQMISPLDELPDVAALEATDKNASAAIVTSCIAGFMRRERLSGNEVTTDQLLSWSWEKILENCAVGRMDTEPIEGITEEIEQEWLKQKERIMTNVFNGTKVRKTPISPVEDEPIELARADRRIGKKRIMIVDGYEVTKENMKSERSSPSSPSTPNPLKRKDQILHDPVSHKSLHSPFRYPLTAQTCIICQKPAEMECQTCPRTFHQQCVDKGSLRKTPHRSPFGFMCPSHYCCECQKPASKADNLLYCCKSCTKAFCEECLDWKFTTFIGTDVYAELGYLPKSTFYIECSQCKASQKTGSGLARAGSKRVKS